MIGFARKQYSTAKKTQHQNVMTVTSAGCMRNTETAMAAKVVKYENEWVCNGHFALWLNRPPIPNYSFFYLLYLWLNQPPLCDTLLESRFEAIQVIKISIIIIITHFPSC